jgi:hypothetical protein
MREIDHIISYPTFDEHQENNFNLHKAVTNPTTAAIRIAKLHTNKHKEGDIGAK